MGDFWKKSIKQEMRSSGEETTQITINSTSPCLQSNFKNVQNSCLHLQNVIACRNVFPANVTTDFPNIIETRATKSEIVIKTEPRGVDETQLSEKIDSNTDTISCNVKKEYLERAKVQYPDIRDGMESIHQVDADIVNQNATINDEKRFEPCASHYTRTSSEHAEKLETNLSELDISNTETIICEIEQEYIEKPSIQIQDVKEDNPMILESIENIQEICLNTDYPTDIKHNATIDFEDRLQPCVSPYMIISNVETLSCSIKLEHLERSNEQTANDTVPSTDIYQRNAYSCSSTVIALPPSQEENLLIPSQKSVSKEKSAGDIGKRHVRNLRSTKKSGPNLNKTRNQTNRKRKKIDWAFHAKTYTKKNNESNEKRTTRNNSIKKRLEEFPKPLKSEIICHADRRQKPDIATELPRPKVLKLESASMTIPQVYRTRTLQPRVRIKRLTGYPSAVVNNRTNNNISTTVNMKKFRQCSHQTWGYSSTDINEGGHICIQNTFSINPWAQDTVAANKDHSCNSPNPSSAFAQNMSNETEYSTDREYVLSSTPVAELTATSSYCDDSGVSISSPCRRDNGTILLEIAAERAFINNHLTRLGYSPMQFELYNDFNDLSIFLKYLFGQPNFNHQ